MKWLSIDDARTHLHGSWVIHEGEAYFIEDIGRLAGGEWMLFLRNLRGNVAKVPFDEVEVSPEPPSGYCGDHYLTPYPHRMWKAGINARRYGTITVEGRKIPGGVSTRSVGHMLRNIMSPNNLLKAARENMPMGPDVLLYSSRLFYKGVRVGFWKFSEETGFTGRLEDMPASLEEAIKAEFKRYKGRTKIKWEKHDE